MKKSIFSLFFCLASLGLSAQKYEDIQPFNLKPLEIECSITCEIPDLDLFEIINPCSTSFKTFCSLAA